MPADLRVEAQEAFNQLSGEQQRSLQQTLGDMHTLSDLMSRTEMAQFGSQLLETNRTKNLQVDLGREFLQDALETYNDPDSGYKLTDAFQRLKDQAEGVRSDRELANLGNISKKLFENSSKIFESSSASDTRSERGVKPGQRLDQLLTSAASKAISESAAARDNEGDSVFSNVLNQALGVAIDQAVTVADNNLENRNREVGQSRSESPELSYSNWQEELDFSEDNDSNSQPYSTAANSALNNLADSTNSATESSVQDSAANLSDTLSGFKFNWQAIFYAAVIICLLAGCMYFLSRFMQPVSEAELKQRELQQKLKANSTNPKDIVEAVDIFLLSRFGADSSWWNAKHAATQITDVQPDWRDKVASLFQVYRWSRYQADSQASVSAEQNDLVKSTLRELSQVPIESFDKTKSSQDEALVVVDAEGES